MKKVIYGSVITFSLTLSFYVMAKHFWRGEVMSQKKVCQRWGHKKFDVLKFKNAKSDKDESVRAEMACSLLKSQKKFIGKPSYEIQKILGESTGYYFSDYYPSYMIDSAQKKGQDSWQIVFLIDRKRYISEVVVHKNCCDRKKLFFKEN